MLVRHDFGAYAASHVIRWDTPLLGCAVAALGWRAGKALTAGAWAVLAWFAVPQMVFSDPAPYGLTAIASALIVAGAANVRLLERVTLRYFGRVSYGLYLWSCLIVRFGLPWPVWLALSLVAAVLSWRFVERPILAWGARTTPNRLGSTIPEGGTR